MGIRIISYSHVEDMNMKTIICFGDTNTWGVDPRTDTRLDFEKRWTGILTKELQNEYRVIEEGQAGRTILSDDPVEPYKRVSVFNAVLR